MSSKFQAKFKDLNRIFASAPLTKQFEHQKWRASLLVLSVDIVAGAESVESVIWIQSVLVVVNLDKVNREVLIQV